MRFLHKKTKYAPLICTAFLLAGCIGLKFYATPFRFTVTQNPSALYLDENIPSHTHLPDALNLNTADKAALMSLPGIGETLSARILSYREEIGRFRHPAQLLEVQGIGEAKYKEIEQLITVE